MKNQINSIGWIGLILSLMACLLFSCKKDNDTKPNAIQTPITNSIQRYVLTSTKYGTEQDTIYLVNSNTLTSPLSIGWMYKDTLHATIDTNNLVEFDQQVKSTTTYYKGNWRISGNTLIIIYNHYNGPPPYTPSMILHTYTSTYTKL